MCVYLWSHCTSEHLVVFAFSLCTVHIHIMPPC
uniref:Uncharacterized protein n=1 Tax=Anguilla anguilla TaxID=7936 RepID=A0A0E9SNK3_ANGAN